MKRLLLVPLAALLCTVPADAALRPGKHFGYIRSLDVAHRRLAFDRADFLTGKAAKRAALADGAIGPGEAVPNDYYIRNRSKRAVWLALADRVTVTHVQ